MKTCKQCGQPMAGDAPEGLCARCLLSAAMVYNTISPVISV
jgi:NMD protein affecting ribosome stability and mRNA decay